MQIRPVVSDYIRRSLLTTRGDIIIRGAAAPERYPAGAAGRILSAHGAGIMPSWEVPSLVNTTRPCFEAYLTPNQADVTGDATWVLLQGD